MVIINPALEFFSFPYKEKFVVYLPLLKIILLADKKSHRILARLKEGRFNQEERLRLTSTGLLRKLRDAIYYQRKHYSISKKRLEVKFSPTNVTLFPTSDCNLRCVYCYAKAGDEPKYMEWKITRAAIDLIIENAKRKKRKEIAISFHGGGEPTLAWPLIRQVREYTAAYPEKVKLRLTTNGILTSSQIKWLASNFTYITISFDGPKEIQDLQRPFSNGKGSFKEVYQTIKELDKYNFPYSIHSVITKESVNKMEKIIKFFCENFKTKTIHLQPLWVGGRAIATGCSSLSSSNFVKQFKRAKDVAEEYGVYLYYPGAALNRIRRSYCGAAGRNFAITPEGYVTSCYEVSSISDLRSDIFIYGKYDIKKTKFIFNKRKIKNLRSLTVEMNPNCVRCISKWHCAGDCPAKWIVNGKFVFQKRGLRCHINQELTKDQIIRLLCSKISREIFYTRTPNKFVIIR